MHKLQRACSILLLLLPMGAHALQSNLSSGQAATRGDFPSLSTGQQAETKQGRDEDGGLIHMDVTVTDKTGKPVTGLGEKNFTLLDNGKPAQLLTFGSFDEVVARPDPPVEVIVVMDEAAHSSDQAADERVGVKKFLLQNDGRLKYPVSIYRLSNEGLSGETKASTDGNALAAEISAKNGLHEIPVDADDLPFNVTMAAPSPSFHNVSYHPQSTLRTLGFVVLMARRKPGRKLLLWISPGKPRGENSFEWVTEFSTRIREARIALYGIDFWKNPDKRVPYESSLEGVHTAAQSSAGNLLMQVLAVQSGGRVVEEPDNDLVRLMNNCVEDASAFYTLSFDSPRTDQVDEYHALKVEIDKPELTARTNTGYYDEPVFYDQPFRAAKRMSVQALEGWLENDKGAPDAEMAKELSETELTERMSSERLLGWKKRMKNGKAWPALTAVADASAFLAPPAAEIPARAAPDMATQRQILSKTVNYLLGTIPKLPDFFATRVTTRYQEAALKEGQTWKTVIGDQSLRLSGASRATVLYRNGYEVVDLGAGKGKKPAQEKGRLTTKGTFGPILSVVMLDAARSSDLNWCRWEQRAGGVLAVFRYRVPKERSHYGVSFRSISTSGAETFDFQRLTGYHGEISIDPESGAVLRLTVEADLEPKLPFHRSSIAVEYGPVEIGGGIRICLVRSVSIARIRTIFDLHEWGGGFVVYGPFETMLDDVDFGEYHMFHGEARVLSGFDASPNQ